MGICIFAASLKREEGAGVRDEAIDQRGVDAVVDGVEEAVGAGGVGVGDCGAGIGGAARGHGRGDVNDRQR
jgi:hypothetical protein